MSRKFSPAERRALKLMAAHPFQDGVIDRYGNVVCAGEHKNLSPATWLRLVARRLVTGDGKCRLTLTGDGVIAAQELENGE